MGESRNNRNVEKEEQEKVGMCEYGKCEQGIGKNVNVLRGNRGMEKQKT